MGRCRRRHHEIRAQGPEAHLAAASVMSHQLQQAFRRDQAAIQKLDSQLTTAMSGGADDG